MLHLDGVVYKPLQGASSLTATPQASRGDKEREFYEHTNNVGHPITAHLPRYLGSETVIDEEGVERLYLKLEDITSSVCWYSQSRTQATSCGCRELDCCALHVEGLSLKNTTYLLLECKPWLAVIRSFASHAYWTSRWDNRPMVRVQVRGRLRAKRRNIRPKRRSGLGLLASRCALSGNK